MTSKYMKNLLQLHISEKSDQDTLRFHLTIIKMATIMKNMGKEWGTGTLYRGHVKVLKYGEIAQWLGELVTLPEDPGSIHT